MFRVKFFILFLILLSSFFSSSLYSSPVLPRSTYLVSDVARAFHADTVAKPIDTLKKDSINTGALLQDTIPQYTIISDTVKTYPFNQDSLNRINVKGIRKFTSPVIGLNRNKVAGDYCLVKPKYWSKSLDGSLNMTEASFSKNWKAGGLNSFSTLATLNGKTDYERYDVSWTNELQSQLGEAATFGVQGLRKTADRLYLDSKFAVKIHQPFYLFTALNFQSQFINGNNYFTDSLGRNLHSKVSGFLAPGYLTESLGLEFKPKPYFSLRLGVGSFRQTFVVDTSVYHNSAGNYGVPIGERALTEAAFQLVANFDKDIAKNVHLIALFQFFESYTSTANTSGRLDITLTGKVNKLLNVSFIGTALYDRSQDTHIQFTQFLSLGVAYKYSDF